MDKIVTDRDLLAGMIDAIVSQALETVVVIDADLEAEDGPKIIFVNPLVERRIGYRKEQLLGRPFKELLGEDMWPDVLRQLRRSRQVGESFRTEVRADDAGRMNSWLDVSTFPVIGASGVAQYFVRIGRDITARKHIEQQHEATQRLLASVFAAIDSPLIVTDESASVIMANGALTRELGWSILDIMGQNLSALVAEVDRPALANMIAQQSMTDEPGWLRLRLLQKSGDTLLGALRLTLIYPTAMQQYFVAKLETTRPNSVNADIASALTRVANRDGSNITVVAGKLQLVGLETIREKLGARWSELAERMHQLAERIIAKYLHSGDICRRTSDEGFVLFFERLTEAEAQFKAQAIAAEVREKLIGETPEAAEVGVASFAASVSIDESDGTAEEEIINTLTKRLDVERRRLEAMARETAEHGLRRAKALCHPLKTGQQERIPIVMVCVPQTIRSAVDTLVSLGHVPYGLEMEVFMLTGAAERVLAAAGNSAELVVAPIRLATTAKAKDFDAWLAVARSLGELGRRQLIAEIVDIPADVASARLADLTMRLSTLFRTVAFELPTSNAVFTSSLPDSTRLVTIAARRLLDAHGEVSVKAVTRLAKRLEIRRCRLIAKDVANPQKEVQLAEAGVALMSSAH